MNVRCSILSILCQAADKGASPTMVGVIIGSSPLCVVFLAPVFGYLVSVCVCVCMCLCVCVHVFVYV